jgi:hypothetical protein
MENYLFLVKLLIGNNQVILKLNIEIIFYVL